MPTDCDASRKMFQWCILFDATWWTRKHSDVAKLDTAKSLEPKQFFCLLSRMANDFISFNAFMHAVFFQCFTSWCADPWSDTRNSAVSATTSFLRTRTSLGPLTRKNSCHFWRVFWSAPSTAWIRCLANANWPFFCTGCNICNILIALAKRLEIWKSNGM